MNNLSEHQIGGPVAGLAGRALLFPIFINGDVNRSKSVAMNVKRLLLSCCVKHRHCKCEVRYHRTDVRRDLRESVSNSGEVISAVEFIPEYRVPVKGRNLEIVIGHLELVEHK